MVRIVADKDRLAKIHSTAQIGEDVEIGDWSKVHEHVVIQGKVKIGRGAWILPYSEIGGGQKELGYLNVGDFLHLGKFAFINIADKVMLGHEVGIGQQTKLYTHGAYLSIWEGFPSKRGPIYLGPNVWLPQATVMPDVTIGGNVVVLTGSNVTRDLPSGCLAGGSPACVIREDVYPTVPNTERRISILNYVITLARMEYKVKTKMDILDNAHTLRVGRTNFLPETRAIEGPVSKSTELVRNLLRREGIRFRYYDKDGEYAEWD